MCCALISFTWTCVSSSCAPSPDPHPPCPAPPMWVTLSMPRVWFRLADCSPGWFSAGAPQTRLGPLTGFPSNYCASCQLPPDLSPQELPVCFACQRVARTLSAQILVESSIGLCPIRVQTARTHVPIVAAYIGGSSLQTILWQTAVCLYVN